MLRPLDALPKTKREEIYKKARIAVRNYTYVTQATRLLKKEKKEREMDTQLRTKKDETARKIEELKERQHQFDLKTVEEQTKINMRKPVFDEYDRKKKIEEEKARKEKESIRQKKEEIEKRQSELREWEQKLRDVEQSIQDHEVYRTFLQKVVDESEKYKDISELMARYSTLKLNADSLNTALRRIEEQNEMEREEHARYLKSKRDELAVANGKMHRLEYENEKLQQELTETEQEEDKLQSSQINQLGATAEVNFAIQNLHYMAQMSKTSAVSEDIRIGDTQKGTPDILRMLDTIQERIEDLRYITGDVKDDVLKKKADVHVILEAQRKEEEEPQARTKAKPAKPAYVPRSKERDPMESNLTVSSSRNESRRPEKQPDKKTT